MESREYLHRLDRRGSVRNWKERSHSGQIRTKSRVDWTRYFKIGCRYLFGLQAGKLLRTEGFKFDLAYTSVLKRAIKTLQNVLEELDQLWVPVEKSWRLNERHYGDLQGRNKAETAKKFGDKQVHVWRRSYDVPPAGHLL